VLLAACGRDSPEGDAAASGDEHASAELGVTLAADERDKLGVELDEVESASYQPAVEGVAQVLDAQDVVGALTDLAKAETDAPTSQTALKRARDLFRSDTAVSAGSLEAAERQAAADDAQAKVARARATLGFGADAPWLDARRRDALLDELAAGTTLVVRAAFPSGTAGAQPGAIELRPVGRVADGGTGGATGLGPAPADPAGPGPGLLALLRGAAGLGSGERLSARVASGAPLTGAVVPRASVVLAGGEAWCYVRGDGDELVRKRVDLGR